MNIDTQKAAFLIASKIGRKAKDHPGAWAKCETCQRFQYQHYGESNRCPGFVDADVKRRNADKKKRQQEVKQIQRWIESCKVKP